MDAYKPVPLLETIQAYAHGWTFMPWAYPPQFNLLLIPLPLMPRWASYILFVADGVGLYCAVVQKLCRNTAELACVALLMLPGVVLSAIVGQNGFITAGLAGLFALAFLEGQARAGVYVGLLSIKPHLALGVAFLLLISRNWRALFVAGITAALGAAVATGVFGFPIWAAFFEGARQAKVFLEAGLYPIHKMTSVYAALFPRIGASKAMIAQIIVTLLSFLLIAFAHMQRWNPQLLVGFTLLASLSMSPYLYYYDLLYLGLFFALTADQFVASSKFERFGLVALPWASMAWILSSRFSPGRSRVRGPVPLSCRRPSWKMSRATSAITRWPASPCSA